MDRQGVKTTREHWDATHTIAPRMRLPSSLMVTIRDIQGLQAKHIKPGMQVLEIGCAPGKQLAYAAKKLGAKVSGIDYSPIGVHYTQELFSALDIQGDVRCEDAFNSSFEKRSFDVVYSIGVVEHFDDPAPLIQTHADFLREGGTALIAIPNYGGIYGRMQAYFDVGNLAIHNLDMMHVDSYRRLAPPDNCFDIQVFRFGHLNPWLISWDRKMPSLLAKAIGMAGNLVGLLLPKIDALSPMLVMIIVRK